MSIRYDPLLTAALADEIGARWGMRRAVAAVLQPRARVMELRFEDGPSLLAFLHPEAGYLLGRDDRLPQPGIRFRRLVLGRAWAPPDERSLLLDLIDRAGRIRYQVVLELATNQWNALVADVRHEEDDGSPAFEARIRSVLWPRDAGRRRLRQGAVYELPTSDRNGVDGPVTLAEWCRVLAPVAARARRRAALRSFAFLSSLNVEYVLGDVAVSESGEAASPDRDPEASASTDQAALEAAFQRYQEVCSTKGETWLLERRWGLQPYVCGLGESGARAAGSQLEAMDAAAASAGGVELLLEDASRAGPLSLRPAGGPTDAVEESGALRAALVRRRRRSLKRRRSLVRELEDTGDPEESRSIGHLLLARLSDLPPRGAARVELEDFDGSPREVDLDPALDIAANARVYFEEAARRERARARLPEELAAVERELVRLDKALERLGEEGASDSLWEVAGGRPEPDAGGGRASGGEPLPFVRLRTSSGLEIRVGRSARANDRLTFAFSAPDDIWLHARQVQGAHVILRWGRRDENPPRQDLVEAALVAAVHSGARHSGSVAVDWTRRKHVRKPRKAPPGTVVPDRVQTLFVEPDEEVVKRLKTRARE